MACAAVWVRDSAGPGRDPAAAVGVGLVAASVAAAQPEEAIVADQFVAEAWGSVVVETDTAGLAVAGFPWVSVDYLGLDLPFFDVKIRKYRRESKGRKAP